MARVVQFVIHFPSKNLMRELNNVMDYRNNLTHMFSEMFVFYFYWDSCRDIKLEKKKLMKRLIPTQCYLLWPNADCAYSKECGFVFEIDVIMMIRIR